MKTLNLNYNSNDIEIRNDDTLVLKPKWCYSWYPEEVKKETKRLRKYYKLKVYFHRTVNDKFQKTGGIHVTIVGDDDIRSSPSVHMKFIKTKDDLRSLIAEALFRVMGFDVGEIPKSLKSSKIAEGHKYLTISISDPDAVAELFSEEYLEATLRSLKSLK